MKLIKIEDLPKHMGGGYYNGRHYFVLKLREHLRLEKTTYPYFRITNLDSNAFVQGWTLPTKNN